MKIISKNQKKKNLVDYIIKRHSVFFSVSGRHSVMAPLTSGSPILAFKFMDLGSCSGGLNRRETALVFTLEDSEYV